MKSKIIVAFDVPNFQSAITLAHQIDPKQCRAKIGMELFTACGPSVVEALMKLGFEIFLDLKFKDIPNTVKGAIRSACGMGVWMTNVHCDGGRKMLDAAKEAVSNVSNPPILIGVTVLTSMEIVDLEEIGVLNHDMIPPMDYFVNEEAKKNYDSSSKTLGQVLRLSELAQKAGLDGVVCSGKEVLSLRKERGDSFLLVVPGIRLTDGKSNDQARIVTPEIAIQSGADYLVVGRPITDAVYPNVALGDFNNRVASVS